MPGAHEPSDVRVGVGVGGPGVALGVGVSAVGEGITGTAVGCIRAGGGVLVGALAGVAVGGGGVVVGTAVAVALIGVAVAVLVGADVGRLVDVAVGTAVAGGGVWVGKGGRGVSVAAAIGAAASGGGETVPVGSACVMGISLCVMPASLCANAAIRSPGSKRQTARFTSANSSSARSANRKPHSLLTLLPIGVDSSGGAINTAVCIRCATSIKTGQLPCMPERQYTCWWPSLMLTGCPLA